VWRFGDAISVEAISPLRYMLSPVGRGRNCLASVDRGFAEAEKDGDLIVAGRNFGHGPGHDHAVLALREAGIAGVVAVSFAPQFYRHAIGHGLLVARCPTELPDALTGPRLRVEFEHGHAMEESSGRQWRLTVPTGPAREIVAAGGLIPFLRTRLDPT
jgi:3-isopropylmalate dehydratase small subunit